MKVFVTGACGQLGFDVVSELVSRGMEAAAADILPEACDLPERASYVQLDITDPDAVLAALEQYRPDAVIHCAAWTAVDAAEDPENRERVFAINAGGTRNIASACKAIDCKMLYISTDYVFDGQGEEPRDPDSRNYAPLNVYGASKLAGEEAVSGTLQRFFIVRTAWAFGKKGQNFVRTMLKLGKTLPEIRVVNDQIGTPTYTFDLARLLVDMVQTEQYGFYHATNEGGFISWYEFACEIMRLAGLPTKIVSVTSKEYGLSKAQRPSNSRLDKSKLVYKGFAPLPEWEDALKRYLDEIGETVNNKTHGITDEKGTPYTTAKKESAKMPIQVLKPKFHIDECLQEIRECLEKGWTGMGFKTVEFENAWKNYTGHRNAYYLNSNTAGLHLAVKILKMTNNWADGDEIITTPITFVSSNHAILYENMNAVFADVDEYLCLDPDDVERKITERTKAVMFVGYGGRVGKLEQIIQLCRRKGLKLILDAAHMSGTKVHGVCPGTWDGVDVSVYSFQAVKNLPTGDSGMICFADDKNDQLARQLAWLGINKDTYARSNQGTYKWKYDVDYLGYKYNGNAIMAAIALVQLKYLDEDNMRRREIVSMYDRGFEGNKNIRIIKAPYADECSFHIYELAVPDREGLLSYLASHDIYCGVHYRDNTEYKLYQYAFGTCPHAQDISQHLITMPLHMWLTDEEVNTIIKTVNKYYE